LSDPLRIQGNRKDGKKFQKLDILYNIPCQRKISPDYSDPYWDRSETNRRDIFSPGRALARAYGYSINSVIGSGKPVTVWRDHGQSAPCNLSGLLRHWGIFSLGLCPHGWIQEDSALNLALSICTTS